MLKWFNGSMVSSLSHVPGTMKYIYLYNLKTIPIQKHNRLGKCSTHRTGHWVLMHEAPFWQHFSLGLYVECCMQLKKHLFLPYFVQLCKYIIFTYYVWHLLIEIILDWPPVFTFNTEAAPRNLKGDYHIKEKLIEYSDQTPQLAGV